LTLLEEHLSLPEGVEKKKLICAKMRESQMEKKVLGLKSRESRM
jgi:hypothetical protein